MAATHWEAYYRSGALVSCPTTTEPNYAREIRKAWVDFFAALPSGTSVLDLGTGNGAVALIARETAEESGKDLDIHGADLARIDPFRDVPDGARLLAGIEFHAGVRCEELPFGDECFGAVCGQYILEYTDCVRSLSEVARVLEPGGVCQFILHHDGSLIVANARESLRQAELVASLDVLRQFRDYGERAAAGRPAAAAARRALLASGETLQAAARESGNPLLLRFIIDSLSSLLASRSRMSRGEMLRRTDLLERQFADWVARLEDLVSAVPGSDEIEDIRSAAAAAGLRKLSLVPQFQDVDTLVGWRLTMCKWCLANGAGVE